jgi:hypothetical protein
MKQGFLFMVCFVYCVMVKSQFQLINGSNTAGKGKPIEFLPVAKKVIVETAPPKEKINIIPAKTNSKVLHKPYPPIDKINAFTTLSNDRQVIISPLNSIDTAKIIVLNEIPNRVETNLRGQNITGLLLPQKGKEVLIQPAIPTEELSADKAPSFASNKMNSIPAIISPTSFLDTNAIANNDPMHTYGLPSGKLNLKSQNIKTGTYIAEKGVSKIMVPIPKDSIVIEPSAMVSGKQNVAIDSTPEYSFSNNNTAINNKNNEAERTATVPVQSTIATTSGTYLRTTFYVSQEGKYAVAFTAPQFYITINNEGKLADYGITTNGVVVNDYTHKVSKVGNIAVTRNYKGDLESIDDVRLGYTYDGKINRIGNLQIIYNRDGLMERIGNIFVEYNYNNTVDKIANYRIGYKHRQVIGIDDSDGLVVFKPSIQN